MVEDIDGKGVIDNSPASLLFLPGGQLAGNASCNRLLAQYSQKGKTLTVSNPGATLMACPEALMLQEQKLLSLLAQVRSYKIDNTGSLVLNTSDGRTLKARRK